MVGNDQHDARVGLKFYFLHIFTFVTFVKRYTLRTIINWIQRYLQCRHCLFNRLFFLLSLTLLHTYTVYRNVPLFLHLHHRTFALSLPFDHRTTKNTTYDFLDISVLVYDFYCFRQE